ncbi:MAG: P-loop NTPase fold protein [Sedimentisphaerales bacterium]
MDDLDRCNVNHIVKVLDAIRLVMTIPNVIVMIGIDHRIAFQAIGKHYEELADGGDTRGAGEVARDYLGKIIQLPLRLRAASHGELKDYVFEKLFDEKSLVDDSKHTEESGRKDFTEKTLKISVSDELLASDRTMVEQETDKAIKGAAAEREVTEEEISEAIKDTKSERNEFYELAGKFDFSNPRQLLRLHNSFRFLKGYGRAKGEEYDTIDILRMLFWQEFLHNWPIEDRNRCMAELIGEVHGEGVKPIVKRILDKVRDDIVKLYNGENYAELAEFVRIVVLPHNEEGIFDTKEDIDEWLKKKATEAVNKKSRRTEYTKSINQ